MSPRAAVRLRQLGFPQVYDYASGKSDWLAAGLPVEGEGVGRLAADALVQDVPTCRSDEPIEAARARLGEQWPFCVVVDETGVVLGLVRADAGGDTVAAAM